MMDDAEFERAARHAARTLRDEAESIADPQAALAALLDDEPAGPPNDVRLDVVTRPLRGRRWVSLSAVAAALVAVAGIVVVAGRDPADAPTTETIVEPPATVLTTDATPATTVEVTSPATEPSVPRSTDPPETDPVSTMSATVVGEIGEPLGRTVLVNYGVGDGAEQLGFEDCQECEPTRPGAPLVSEAGDIVIADPVNDRWQVIRDGVWQGAPFSDGQRVVGSPIRATDGYIYAVVPGVAAASTSTVVAIDPTELVVRASYPMPIGAVVAELHQVNDDVMYGDAIVTSIQHRPDLPSWDLDSAANLLRLTIADVEQVFALPAAWLVSTDSVSRFDDGSVALHALATGREEDEWLIARFWADGSFTSGTLTTRPATTGSIGRFTTDGWVQLEDDAIVRYALPEFDGPDPLSDWAVPDVSVPTLDAVPRWFPADLVDAPPTVTGGESVGAAFAGPSYAQTWVRTERDGTVTGLLDVTTGFTPTLVNSTSDRVEVPGWPIARSSLMGSDDLTHITVHTAERFVSLASQGIAEDEVVRLAGALVTDVDGVGWATPPFSSEETWVSIHEGWETGTAARWLRGPAPDGSTLELTVTHGMPSTVLTPRSLDGPMHLIRIDDHPALLFDRGDLVGLSYSPAADVVVVLGSDGTGGDLIDVAESLVEVDAATWDLLVLAPEPGSDGCTSFFC